MQVASLTIRRTKLAGLARQAAVAHAAAALLVTTGAAVAGASPPVLVMHYDAITSVVTPVPWSLDGFSFGADDSISIGMFEGYGLVVIDPPGGGRTITIPTSLGSSVAGVTEAGGKVTVRYTDGSTATVPGKFVPPDQIELDKGKGKPGKAAAAAPAPVSGADMDRLMDDFRKQEWNMLHKPFTLDYHFGGGTPYQLFGSSFDVNFGAEGSVGLAFAVPEPSTWAMLLGGLVAIGLANRRRARATA
ncbi:PEPxxWA-CTERM sorting domain-containing protein [Roseateles albus]|uniref:PEPxxWA-CTERM sorting domain-containing protein n=1 Tax=Roseateles albus TaxID=2987525 RepID=A0ABT5KKH4_9BURK|nr:PEPxxWA-CTERM sorting domain-containing protein [Roseateles albus]MDC8774433.1 PEPxxWA-CTERM sorting domain-containing protein [Roseateles albus]